MLASATTDTLAEPVVSPDPRDAWGFIGGMPLPLTTDEQLAARLEPRKRIRERERQEERTR
jgi:hypothetical protein